jgi:hypothetical protein
VKLPTEVDPAQLLYAQHRDSNGSIASLCYGRSGRRLLLQTPWGVVSVSEEDPRVLQVRLSRSMVECVSRIHAWLSENPPPAHRQGLKRVASPITDVLYARIPCGASPASPQLECYQLTTGWDEEQQEPVLRDLRDIDLTACRATCILELVGVWTAGDSYGASWRVLRLCARPRLALGPGHTAFKVDAVEETLEQPQNQDEEEAPPSPPESLCTADLKLPQGLGSPCKDQVGLFS